MLAANGYARTSGRLGVATVTHGPALTNTVTALAEGVRDRTPIVLLAGDTPVADKTNLQNIPQREVVLASGAGFEQVRTPQTVAEDLATAIFRAHAESRPVVLNVPVDFQWEEIEYQRRPAPADRARRRSVPTPPPSMPRSGSSPRPGVPSSWPAGGPARRRRGPRCCGWPTGSARRWPPPCGARTCSAASGSTSASTAPWLHSVALEVFNASDCLIAFGASLNRWTTAEGSLLAKKQVVQVDVDRDSINR